MDTREWIFVFGVIAVVIIALILAAKWRRQRFDDIQSGDYSDADLDDDFGSNELPGGGARTVGYRDPTDIERMNDEIRVRAEASKPRLSSFRPEPVVQPSLLDEPEENFDDDYDGEYDNGGQEQESVPLLLDPSDEHNSEVAFAEAEDATTADDNGGLKSSSDQEPETEALNKKASNKEHLQELENLADDLKEPEPELELHVDREDQPAHIQSHKNPAETRTATKQDRGSQQTGSARPSEPQSEEPGEIIIINLMTEPTKPYEGTELLKLALELGLRHGDMDIFHYCGRHGDEQPQFRMANLLKPGYFDISNMDQTRTHALCFFFELMSDQDNMRIYESMLSVINKLRDDLGGELHDENRSVFTIQTSEHCRNRIRDFQRRHLLKR